MHHFSAALEMEYQFKWKKEPPADLSEKKKINAILLFNILTKKEEMTGRYTVLDINGEVITAPRVT